MATALVGRWVIIFSTTYTGARKYVHLVLVWKDFEWGVWVTKEKVKMGNIELAREKAL